MIVAGGGVLYSEAQQGAGRLRGKAWHSGCRDPGRQVIPAARAIRSAWVRSASPARRPPTSWRKQADVVLAVGSRLQDFTTGSWSLFKNEGLKIVGLNVTAVRCGQA